MPLPTTPDLRTNFGTWAVRTCQLPAVAHFMHDALPNEVFDPHFWGQSLATVYFDTAKGLLRKARASRDQYLTLRVRCYKTLAEDEIYALSAKTEAQKFRAEIPKGTAYSLLSGGQTFEIVAKLLPADLLARLLDISAEQPIVPVVRINCQRYAIEDDQDRFTLDTDVRTDLGTFMTYSVLEFKSTKKKEPPPALQAINLHPIKLSKFIWATRA